MLNPCPTSTPSSTTLYSSTNICCLVLAFHQVDVWGRVKHECLLFGTFVSSGRRLGKGKTRMSVVWYFRFGRPGGEVLGDPTPNKCRVTLGVTELLSSPILSEHRCQHEELGSNEARHLCIVQNKCYTTKLMIYEVVRYKMVSTFKNFVYKM